MRQDVRMRELEVHPLTPDRWPDLVELFGETRGAYSGCWCMYFRQTNAEFSEGARKGGPKNRDALKGIVDGGRVPGLLGYLDGRPVGWVSVAPREEFGRVERSRSTKPIDERPAWAIVCFYLDRHHRGQGVATGLLDAAVAYAERNGATLVEGYPIDPGDDGVPNAEAYYGIASMFERAGFEQVAARTPKRRVMRRELPG
jgi:GNAT superfamily N-acetyltransferase